MSKQKHSDAITYFALLTESILHFFSAQRIEIMLLDTENRILCSSGGKEVIPDLQNRRKEMRLPVCVNGEEIYRLCAVSEGDEGAVQGAVMAILSLLKQSMQLAIEQGQKLTAREKLLDAAPVAFYHVLPDSEIAYANQLGKERLARIGADANDVVGQRLNDLIHNYKETPIYRGVSGIPSYNQEVTWVTDARTYEDITTVVPIDTTRSGEGQSVVTVSMPIEDLRSLVAHTAGYTAKYNLNSLVGESPVLQEIRERAVRVARKKHHVLLLGEEGTGKQRFAHGIHKASDRSKGPLISIRCGDVHPELLGQELFGIALSAEVSRPGKLELASGGSLFIRDIESLPKAIMRSLAKVLREGHLNRLGEHVMRTIDVRIIAASARDIKKMVEQSLFDAELYEILSKSILRLPTLRNRMEDMHLLSNHILWELSIQHHLPEKHLTKAAEKKLSAYDWPGNVKQLQHVLEYAFFHTENAVIDAEDIQIMGSVRPSSPWKEDREVFVKAWEAAGHNVSRLANLLNVSRVTLYRYLKKYGVEK